MFLDITLFFVTESTFYKYGILWNQLNLYYNFGIFWIIKPKTMYLSTKFQIVVIYKCTLFLSFIFYLQMLPLIRPNLSSFFCYTHTRLLNLLKHWNISWEHLLFWSSEHRIYNKRSQFPLSVKRVSLHSQSFVLKLIFYGILFLFFEFVVSNLSMVGRRKQKLCTAFSLELVRRVYFWYRKNLIFSSAYLKTDEK